MKIRRQKLAEVQNATADNDNLPTITPPPSAPSARLLKGECVAAMDAMAAASVDLVVTSPPYLNFGMPYGDGFQSIEDYVEFSRQWITAAARVLKPGGAMWINVGMLKAGPNSRVPLTYYLFPLIAGTGLTFVQEIVWDRRAQQNTVNRFATRSERWLYLVKPGVLKGGRGRPKNIAPTFNLDAVRRAPNAVDKRNNPAGANPADIWEFVQVHGTSKERTAHPCPFPQAMIERIVLACSNVGDVVMDPFGGSGTTGAAAMAHSRSAVMIEREPTYWPIIEKRLGLVDRVVVGSTKAEAELFADFHHGDAIEKMKLIPSKSVNLILCDPPFATTNCSWDQLLPAADMWREYERILAPNGMVVLHAAQPFTTDLIMSNRSWFSQHLIWEKTRAVGFLHAKRRHMAAHEDVLVFKRPGGKATYNPQGVVKKNAKTTRRGSVGEVYRDSYTKNEWVNDSGNYPRSVLKFKSERNHGHPTQKPQALAEYLIRTFSNPGDVVLDHCYGSGTTGAAAMGTGRSFIGVERDPMWFQKGRARILAAAGGGERPSPTTPVAANDVLPKIEQVPVALDGLMATEGLRLPAAPAQRLVNKCDARVEEVGALKVVDLFCGAGGLSLGFELASHEVVAAFDFWNRAVETYRLNFDHPVFELDLTDVASAVKAIRPYAPDLIAGGPPCQEFSSAGSRSEGGKANLTRTFAEIVSAIRPRMFVMENVGRASSSVAYRAAREIFKSAGYGLTERVLDASLCGVPQKRKRFFCIGILDGEDGVLNAFLDESFASQAMTVRDYMGSEIDFDHYYRHPRNYARRAVFSVDEPSPTIRGVNRPVPKTHKRHAGDTEHPAKVEALTQEHRARIQTFPVGFQWGGCKTEQDQMIGNAVPVELGRYIAKAISRYATHPVAALTDGHRITGIEQSAEYCQMAGERLAAGQYGTGLNDNVAGHSGQKELIEDAA